MSCYRVRFFKRLVNSQGRLFKTLEGSFELIEANSSAHAVVIAERQFERIRGIPDWRLYADTVETETLTSAHLEPHR
jgi:hypothetical protein